MLALSSPDLHPAPPDSSTTRTPESFLVQNTSLICHLKSYKGSPPLHHKVQTPFISADKLPAFFSLSCTNAHTGPIAFLEPALRLRSSRSALAARPACSAFAVFSTSVTKEAFPNTPSRRANGPGPAPRGHLASLFATRLVTCLPLSHGAWLCLRAYHLFK